MRKGTCKFHIGSWHNTHCAAGVEYKSVLTEPERLEGSAFRYPCVQCWKWWGKDGLSADQQAEFEKRGTCQKYTEPTTDEIKAYDAEVEAYTKRFLLTLPLIKRIKNEHNGTDWAGTVTCPVCHQRLYMTHAAYNGHVWGNCETEGCLKWME